jgi:hypothetical protein
MHNICNICTEELSFEQQGVHLKFIDVSCSSKILPLSSGLKSKPRRKALNKHITSKKNSSCCFFGGFFARLILQSTASVV